jgi:hypothetical protein
MASPVSPLLPLALDEARRVGGSAASDLDAVLGDLEAWVNFDTPSDDVAALDAFAEVFAGTLESYGLQSDLVEAGDGGRYLHAVPTAPILRSSLRRSPPRLRL